MTLQPDLYGDETADPTLGENQRVVLRVWLEVGRLDEDEAGAIIHERQKKHGRDARCEWCTRDGRAVLRSLHRRGLIKGLRLSRKRDTGTASSDALSRAEGIPW